MKLLSASKGGGFKHTAGLAVLLGRKGFPVRDQASAPAVNKDAFFALADPAHDHLAITEVIPGVVGAARVSAIEVALLLLAADPVAVTIDKDIVLVALKIAFAVEVAGGVFFADPVEPAVLRSVAIFISGASHWIEGLSAHLLVVLVVKFGKTAPAVVGFASNRIGLLTGCGYFARVRQAVHELLTTGAAALVTAAVGARVEKVAILGA